MHLHTLCKTKGRAPRGTRLPRLTSHYYILIDRRTLLTRLVVPSAPKTSSVLKRVPRCLRRFHRVMSSSASGAGPLRGGTTLWLMRFLLLLACTLCSCVHRAP